MFCHLRASVCIGTRNYGTATKTISSKCYQPLNFIYINYFYHASHKMFILFLAYNVTVKLITHFQKEVILRSSALELWKQGFRRLIC